MFEYVCNIVFVGLYFNRKSINSDFLKLIHQGGKTVPIDDICLILTACCPDTKSEVFLWETAQVGLRSQHPENHSYSFDDLREFLDREPKMYNTFCAFFDKVKRELLNRNPNAY